jgi:hypothetical protein
MTLRITLCDEQPSAPGVPIVSSAPTIAGREELVPVFADWDDDQVPALLLYLGDEPEIGKRFRYSGVDWEIVDYHDGWVARMLVD